jgi:hypothetical protein
MNCCRSSNIETPGQKPRPSIVSQIVKKTMSAMVSSDAKPTILVAGGAGFIGTHTCVELLAAGFKVLVIDNMDNASPRALERVREISKCEAGDVVLCEVDLLDLEKTEAVFKEQYVVQSLLLFRFLLVWIVVTVSLCLFGWDCNGARSREKWTLAHCETMNC